MPKQRKRAGSKSKIDARSSRESALTSREDAVGVQEEQLRAGEKSAVAVKQEIEALMAALRDANGHLIVANLRSQTLAEQLNELYEEAKNAIQAKDEFFTLISHELRTPLTSITGWAALLGRDLDSETVAEAARSIASSAALQAKLIDDLLDISRIMTGKFAITAAEIDLRVVVEETMREMRPAAAAKGLSLRTTALRSVIINGDASRLGQVVGNLLANAVKFTPAGGLVETCLTLDGAFAVIEVRDTGEGISPSFLPLVFERRAQATNRRFAGLGLGLAIVKHIVELHGGSVAAVSEGEGKGATFTIRIPHAV